MELELPERPYSVETLSRINEQLPGDEIYFVMGADSWRDITNWREWEKVLSLSNHIVVTRPGADIVLSHVTDEVRSRIVDMRGTGNKYKAPDDSEHRIYITDKVNIDVAARDIRSKIRSSDRSWINDVPVEVANYIEKYQIYN
jgi:nicotinate-nucleotide adenylyltransferase